LCQKTCECMRIDVYVFVGQNMCIQHKPTEAAGYNSPLWWKFSKYNLRHVKTSYHSACYSLCLYSLWQINKILKKKKNHLFQKVFILYTKQQKWLFRKRLQKLFCRGFLASAPLRLYCYCQEACVKIPYSGPHDGAFSSVSINHSP